MRGDGQRALKDSVLLAQESGVLRSAVRGANDISLQTSTREDHRTPHQTLHRDPITEIASRCSPQLQLKASHHASRCAAMFLDAQTPSGCYQMHRDALGPGAGYALL